MQSHPNRRRQAAERRDQILNAACAVFAEKGYAGASMRDIAREVGVTEGLIYHYFSGKHALMHACWRERSFRVQLRALLDEHRDAPIEVALTEMLRRMMELLHENGAEIRLHMAEMQRDPELAGFFIAKVEEDLQWLVDSLRERQIAGELLPDAPIETTARLLMGSAHSIFMVWGTGDREQWLSLVDREAPAIVRVILRGVEAQATDGTRGGCELPGNG